jgi:ribosomal protein S12 methylthiotransferase accessory factor
VAQVRPALRRRRRDPETKQRIEELVADPHLVAELEDHDLLYSHKGSLGAFAFLFDRPAVVQAWEPSVPEKQIDGIQRLADHCHSMGSDLLYCDLTPPDMLALGLHTVRAIIPNCQPIHFGWKERRLGGDRLYDLPRHLKIASSRTTIEQLNPDPHPLA